MIPSPGSFFIGIIACVQRHRTEAKTLHLSMHAEKLICEVSQNLHDANSRKANGHHTHTHIRSLAMKLIPGHPLRLVPSELSGCCSRCAASELSPSSSLIFLIFMLKGKNTTMGGASDYFRSRIGNPKHLAGKFLEKRN